MNDRDSKQLFEIYRTQINESSDIKPENYTKDKKLEEFIQNTLTKAPFNFELMGPVTRDSRTSQGVSETFLAKKKETPSMVVTRYNLQATGELYETIVNRSHNIRGRFMPFDIEYRDMSHEGSYHISVPWFNTASPFGNWKEDLEAGLVPKKIALQDLLKPSAFAAVKGTFERYNKLVNNPTDQNMLDFIYQINKTTEGLEVKGRAEKATISIPSGMDPTIFKDAIIHGDYELRDDETDMRNSPLKVTGKFSCYQPKKLDGLKLGYGDYDVMGHSKDEVVAYLERQQASKRLRQAVKDDDELGLADLFDNI